MTQSTEFAVVIPCLNEARTVYSVVTAVRSRIERVIVVDDGSTDKTGDEAVRAGATVFRHAVPKGKGAALTRGFREAVRQGALWALAMDGDGQHVPEDIPDFLRACSETSARMIVGNRMGNAGPMPFVRRLVNRWMSSRLSRFCGVQLPDSQCGFRLIHLPSWQQFNFSASHFEIESELLVRFALAGLPVQFIPVQTRYAGEESKIHPWRDTLRWFSWLREMKREFGPARRSVSPPNYGSIVSDAAV